jgi:hypothetical protein
MNLRETWHEKSSWWNQRNLFQRSYVKEPMRKNTFVKMGNYFKGSFLRELGLAKMSLDHKTQLSINQMDQRESSELFVHFLSSFFCCSE